MPRVTTTGSRDTPPDNKLGISPQVRSESQADGISKKELRFTRVKSLVGRQTIDWYRR